jgi:hypothetical protein
VRSVVRGIKINHEASRNTKRQQLEKRNTHTNDLPRKYEEKKHRNCRKFVMKKNESGHEKSITKRRKIEDFSLVKRRRNTFSKNILKKGCRQKGLRVVK